MNFEKKECFILVIARENFLKLMLSVRNPF